MGKQTRQQKREEEARILAEMDAAMAEQRAKGNVAPMQADTCTKYEREYDSSMPKHIHCRRCKTLMENGKCPLCGHTVYVPMNKEKQRKIKWIATGVLLVVFAALFAVVRLMK